MKILKKLYNAIIFEKPIFAILAIAFLTLFFGYQAQYFRLDASSDTLTLENDQSLEYYRQVKDRYGSDDYLVITFTSKHVDLFAPETLEDLRAFESDIRNLENIESITSILSVPLIEYIPLTIEEVDAYLPTLRHPYTDVEKARAELLKSALYNNLLISQDGQTTALFVQIQEDVTLGDYQKQWQMDIDNIRKVTKKYSDHNDIYIGGVPMIVADSISYIANDLKIFGGVIIGFIALILKLIFRRMAWVMLPIIISLCVSVWVIGLLGFLGWPVTIVSSNFISLLLIFTLSFCVHIIVKYKEYLADHPKEPQKKIVTKTISNISVPCFYMVITTMAAFISLVMSDIPPVIDFGWMMAMGLAIAFALSFTLMPAIMVYLKKDRDAYYFDFTHKITTFFSSRVKNNIYSIFGIFSVLIVLSLWGMSDLYVQNRFIDYYKKDTEIYKGMETIDKRLGGTTPMDVVISAPQDFIEYQKQELSLMIEDGFYEEGKTLSMEDGYWLSEQAVNSDIPKIHDYLESLPETGKILSLQTTFDLLNSMKDPKDLDRFYIGVLHEKMPDNLEELLFSPYISDDGNEMRFSVRVYESHEGVNRQDMIDDIQNYLTTTIGLPDDQVNITGMVVLYNNVLQSLFKSQILTIGFVFVTMFVMFLILFRNFWVAVVAIIPNITITLFVLGVMGWFGIPMDIMTITIAAICFGIADDNTIHYIHRFMEEFNQTRNYKKSLNQSRTKTYNRNTMGR